MLCDSWRNPEVNIIIFCDVRRWIYEIDFDKSVIIAYLLGIWCWQCLIKEVLVSWNSTCRNETFLFIFKKGLFCGSQANSPISKTSLTFYIPNIFLLQLFYIYLTYHFDVYEVWLPYLVGSVKTVSIFVSANYLAFSKENFVISTKRAASN